MNLRQRLREESAMRVTSYLLSTLAVGVSIALSINRNIEVMHPRFSPHLRAQISSGSCPRLASPSSFLD